VSTRAALISGTAVSLAVTAAWSWTATLTEGPAAPLHLTRDLPGDYMQVGTAATGSTWVALLAVTAGIYAGCFLASGLRGRRKARREASRDPGHTENAEAVPVSGRSWR
jgi:hypothetical protein